MNQLPGTPLWDQAKALRKQATEIEQTAREDERERTYIRALHEERAHVEAKLRTARTLGEARERVRDPFDPERWHEGPTGAEVVRDYEQRLADIDTEIARVERAPGP